MAESSVRTEVQETLDGEAGQWGFGDILAQSIFLEVNQLDDDSS